MIGHTAFLLTARRLAPGVDGAAAAASAHDLRPLTPRARCVTGRRVGSMTAV